MAKPWMFVLSALVDDHATATGAIEQTLRDVASTNARHIQADRGRSAARASQYTSAWT